MIELFAILLPLIISLIITTLYRFQPGTFFTSREKRQLKNQLTPLVDEEVEGDNSTIRWGFLLFGLPIALLQYLLIIFAGSEAQETLFAYRAWDHIIYPLLPAMFLSTLGASAMAMSRRARSWPRERMRNYLLMSYMGIAYYSWFRYYRQIAVGLGIALTLMNLVTSRVFIAVNHSDISYSAVTSLRTTTRPLDDILCILRYSHRKTPNGVINRKPYIEIVFADDSRLDTFYLIERKHQRPFIESLRRGAASPIPLIKIGAAGNDNEQYGCELDDTEADTRPSNLMTGFQMIKEGKYQQAYEFFAPLAANDPDNRDIQLYLGNALVRLGRYPDAITHLERALALGGREIEILRLLAWSYLENGENDAAIQHYTTLIEVAPDDDKAYLNRAGLYHAAGDEASALLDLRESCALGNRNGCHMLRKLEAE